MWHHRYLVKAALATPPSEKPQFEEWNENKIRGGIAGAAATHGVRQLGSLLGGAAWEADAVSGHAKLDEASAGMLKHIMKSKANVFRDPAQVPPELRKLPGAFLPEQTGPAGAIWTHYNAPEAILAHELGHSSGRNILSRTQDMTHTIGILGEYSPYAAMLGSFATYDPEDESIKGKLKNIAKGTALGSAAAAPQLIEEARASLRAIKGLKAIGASPARISAARRLLLKAFGTYAWNGLGGSALGALGGVSLGWGLRRKLVDAHQAKKAVETKQAEEHDLSPYAEGALGVGGLGLGAVGAAAAPAAWSADAGKILNVAGTNHKTILRNPGVAADTLADYLEGGVGLSRRKGLHKTIGEELLAKSKAMSRAGFKPPRGDLGATRHYKAFGSTPTAAMAQSIDEVLFGKTMKLRDKFRDEAVDELLARDPMAALRASIKKTPMYNEQAIKARAFREAREPHHVNEFLQRFKQQVEQLGMSPRDALKGIQAKYPHDHGDLIRRLALDKAKVAPIYAKQIRMMRALPAVGGTMLGGAALLHWMRNRKKQQA